jgi:hypothetical protein
MMISDAQVTAMSSRMLDQFGQDLCLRLATELPDWEKSAPEADREHQLAGLLHYGRQLRLSDSDDLYRFSLAMLRFGLSIPLPQPLAAEFRRTDLSSAAQVESLLLRLISGRDGKTPVEL